MSDTQVAALDHTVQQANVWLKKLTEDHHLGDRHHAYNALRARAPCATRSPHA